MRKKVFIAALSCSLLAVMSATSAYAQMPGTTIRATIPFDFTVRAKVMPAGEYEIRRTSDAPDGLTISNLNDKHDRILFETELVLAPQISRRGEIVFHRYGDTYFLSEVFAGGEQAGRELIPSRQERRLRRETASNGAQPEMETVAVVAY